MMRLSGVGLLVFALGACATEPTAVVAGGMFHHPDGYFSCAVPGADQRFSGPSEIKQSGALVRFRDQTNLEVSLEINGSGIHGIHQEEYQTKGRDGDGVFRDEFERGFVALLDEVETEPRPDLYARMGVMQMPYFPAKASYMGAMLAENYRLSEAPPPVVRVIANLMVEETHYTVIYSVPAQWFLPEGTPLRDVEVIKEGLEARRVTIVPRVTEALSSWLATCRLSGFAKAQIPYRPPVRSAE